MEYASLSAEERVRISAVSSRLKSFSVPLLVWPDASPDRVRGDYQKSYLRKIRVFSGTLFQVDGRFFILTCGHALPKAFVPGRLTLAVKYSSDASKYIINWWRQQWPDIGVIELSRSVTEILPEKQFLTIDDFFAGQLPVESPTLVCGYPYKDIGCIAIRHGKNHGDWWLTLQSQVLPLEPIPFSRLPQVDPLAPTPDADVDIFMRYDSSKSTERQLSGRVWTAPLGNPQGLSGGGIWVCAPRLVPIYHPNLKLIGIQCRGDARQYLRGCRVHTAIEFLAAKCPKLRSALRIPTWSVLAL